MTTILGLAGSLRDKAHNRGLVLAAAELAPSNVDVVVGDLAGVPLFNQDHEEAGFATPALATLVQQVRDADALLIATPEYNKGVPGVLKNALDWLTRTRPSVLDGKPAMTMGATPGAWGTRIAQQQLRDVLVSCGCLVQLHPEVYVRSAQDVFDDGRLVDDGTRERVDALVAALAEWSRRLADEG